MLTTTSRLQMLTLTGTSKRRLVLWVVTAIVATSLGALVFLPSLRESAGPLGSGYDRFLDGPPVYSKDGGCSRRAYRYLIPGQPLAVARQVRSILDADHVCTWLEPSTGLCGSELVLTVTIADVPQQIGDVSVDTLHEGWELRKAAGKTLVDVQVSDGRPTLLERMWTWFGL